MARRNGKLIDVCIDRAGYRKGTKVAFRLLQVATVARAAGRFPTVELYCEWTGVSLRTGWAHRAEIREFFSEDEFRLIVDQLAGARVDEQPRTKAISTRIELPRVRAAS